MQTHAENIMECTCKTSPNNVNEQTDYFSAAHHHTHSHLHITKIAQLFFFCSQFHRNDLKIDNTELYYKNLLSNKN